MSIRVCANLCACLFFCLFLGGLLSFFLTTQTCLGRIYITMHQLCMCPKQGTSSRLQRSITGMTAWSWYLQLSMSTSTLSFFNIHHQYAGIELLLSLLQIYSHFKLVTLIFFLFFFFLNKKIKYFPVCSVNPLLSALSLIPLSLWRKCAVLWDEVFL